MAADGLRDLAEGSVAVVLGNVVSLLRGQLRVGHIAIFLVGKGCMLPHTGLFLLMEIALARRM